MNNAQTLPHADELRQKYEEAQAREIKNECENITEIILANRMRREHVVSTILETKGMIDGVVKHFEEKGYQISFIEGDGERNGAVNRFSISW